MTDPLEDQPTNSRHNRFTINSALDRGDPVTATTCQEETLDGTQGRKLGSQSGVRSLA